MATMKDLLEVLRGVGSWVMTRKDISSAWSLSERWIDVPFEAGVAVREIYDTLVCEINSRRSVWDSAAIVVL
jgi:hypothetical protein